MQRMANLVYVRLELCPGRVLGQWDNSERARHFINLPDMRQSATKERCERRRTRIRLACVRNANVKHETVDRPTDLAGG